MGNFFEALLTFCGVCGMIFAAVYAYRSIFVAVGLFTTKVFPKTEHMHKYAILIPARNEETVIGNLLDSIAEQDYPSELLSVFVVADNCTDKTAEIARAKGAVCYERFDNEHRTKGYALQFLFENIERDYKIDSFEGYFIFDSDNLLKCDYISRMNEAFDSGEKIITSYRNTKNFDDSIISSSYALHWMRSSRTEHRARSVMKIPTRIQGTGYLFASEIVANGWKYTSFTEDRAFSADAIVNGYNISYCDAAEFYDEQPSDLKIAMRQRIRWAKGHLQAFVELGGKLFCDIFKKGASGMRRIASADMFFTVFPHELITAFTTVLVILAFTGLIVFDCRDFLEALEVFGRSVLRFAKEYGSHVVLSAYVCITEFSRIKKMKAYKYVLYVITFPIFDFIGYAASLIALCTKVTWKPIPHRADLSIKDIENMKREASGIKK